MLADSGYTQERDTRTFNNKLSRKELPVVTPISTQEDSKAYMSLFIVIPNGMKLRPQ